MEIKIEKNKNIKLTIELYDFHWDNWEDYVLKVSTHLLTKDDYVYVLFGYFSKKQEEVFEEITGLNFDETLKEVVKNLKKDLETKISKMKEI